ncbi:MAG TPA: hypothetical protein PK079_05110 [Leptospiraceae bacterium]|nr:hypothetical protein [Leptospiraceae bacterium]HMW06250.1 hypothetical protein [Leptospiraceae bacterium]HMX35257.1 hypothetical protein [Leptospiraceae bacterium]HMY31712.1 hypothetical protein [Leptospiraceae bacterium]HMZ65777.1 hypothetical protein [Leptospiraceae bacterium]
MKNYWIGLGEFKKVEIYLHENEWIECVYDWDGGAHNPTRSRISVKDFLKNIPSEVGRLLSSTDLQELVETLQTHFDFTD